MALPFLKSESEENATQAIAFIGICIMTVGLTIMNVTGAIAGSEGTEGGRWLIRGALAIILSGAELLAAVALVRVMLAQNNLRKVVGAVLFLGLAWACIQNGKRAVHLVYPEFAESAALLTAKANVAAADAVDLATAQKSAIDATPVELATVRTGIAKLEAEQTLMASQSPENIMRAQALLIAQGKYFGEVDGKREDLTEAAMRSRGEEISTEMGLLKIRERNLSAGAVAVVTAPNSKTEGEIVPPAVRQADLEDKARKAKAATIWLEVMLWVFEGARSFGLWALVATITAKPVIRRSDEVEDGMVNINMSEEEWKAYEDALAAADGAPPKNPADLLRVGQEGYWIERIGKALKTRMRNPTAEGMFNTYFSGIGSVHELRAYLSLMLKRGALSQDHFDFITREGKYAPPEQQINGEDHSEEGANDVDDTGTDQLPATA